jgi:hypothetical protein
MSHHFDYSPPPDDSGTIVHHLKKGDQWTVTFKHNMGNTKIIMIIPKKGVFEDPGSPRVVTEAEADALGQVIGPILKHYLK